MASIKKSKIDFKKPRYILPIIFLPFFAFFSHIYKSFGQTKTPKSQLVQSDKLNSDLPAASKEVSKDGFKDKFESMKDDFGKEKDLTAVKQFELNYKEGDSVDLSSYTYEERADILRQIRMDSLKKVSDETRAKGLALAKELQDPHKRGSHSAMDDFNKIGTDDSELQAQLKQLFGTQNNTAPNKDNKNKSTAVVETSADDIQDNQINLFREQMRIVDSLNTANPIGEKNSNTKNPNQKIASKQFFPKKDTNINHINTNINKTIGFNSNQNGENADNLSKIKGNMFNTVYAGQKNAAIGIPAIIDMNEKAIAASRIRLKVLQSFKAGQYTIERGSYIYAFVTGFGTQRVMLSITNILQNNHSIPVKLSLYDNDGYIGLYVPGSVFREFTKDVGDKSTQGLSSITMSEEESTNLTKPLITALFQSSSKSISDMIKKSKVKFKYNYIVYLSEEKESK